MGPLKHLSKEALEAAAEPDDLSEWADMQFLLWDAQRRAGISDAEITAAMEDKLKINMERQWPEPKDGEPRLHIKEPGNYPVTPDSWISCSERMPEKYDFDIWVFSLSRGVLDGLQWDGSMFTDDEYQFVIHDATHWMRKAYPAAPQQEVE
ncbi:dATP/dGTP pyrophosphohydrolase domain-containing protein [Escherichia coli]|uniref:dATP/dGTP pyrophosphohydrolase domain-containing protein n=1 Tax=Escherichia coli TaxID=562 RepID=UPI00207B3F50